MKKLLLTLFGLTIATFTLQPLEAAHASGSTTVTGKWKGIAFANSLIDLNADGNAARTFDVDVWDQSQIRFTKLQGFVDTTLIAVPGQPGNNCDNPATEFELEPLGTVIFRGYGDGAIYTQVDSSVHLCFDPTNPSERMVANITGGTGIYAGKTGTAEFILVDTVLAVNANQFPLAVDTRGSWTVTFE